MAETNPTTALAAMIETQMEQLHDASALLLAIQRMFAANDDPMAHAGARLAAVAGGKLKDVLFAMDLLTTASCAPAGDNLDRPLRVGT